MKTFSQFNEAISAARLAQLAAKGKGGAAKAKMAADGLQSQKKNNPTIRRPERKPTSNRGSVQTVRPGTGMPRSGGSAIVKRPQPKLPNSKGSALATRPSAQPTSRGGAIAKSNSAKIANPNIKKARVKVDQPEQQTKRPGTTRPTSTTTTNKPQPKGKERREPCPAGQVRFGGKCRTAPSIRQPVRSTDDSVSTGSVQGLKTKNSD